MKTADTLKITGKVRFELKNIKTGEIKIVENSNIFTTVGKISVAESLRGLIGTGVGEVTWCALGTESTTPLVSDVTIGTEVIRKLVSVRGNANAIAVFQTYFNTSEANYDLEEAGLFGGIATTTPESGTLFAHSLMSITKTSAETLTVTWTITIG